MTQEISKTRDKRQHSKAIRGLLRDFAAITLGRVASAVLQAGLFVLLARSISPGDFGVVVATTGLLVFLQAVADFGITALLSQVRVQSEDDGLVRAGAFFSIWSSCALAVVCAVLLISFSFSQPIYLMLVPLAATAALERVADTYMAVALADGRAARNVANLTARRVVALAAFILLAVVGRVDPVLSFGISTVSAAILSAFSATRTVRISRSVTVRARELLLQSWPFWMNSMAVQGRNLDAAVVGAVAGPVISGLYGAAARLTTVFRIVPTSLATALLPNVSRLVGSGDRLKVLIRPVSAVMLVSSMMYCAAAIVVPFIVPVMLGAEYAAVVDVIQVTLVGMPFAAAASLSSSILQGLGLKHYVGGVSVVFTLVCLGFVAAGALVEGPVGAAWGLAGSFVVQAGLLSYKLRGAVRSFAEFQSSPLPEKVR